MGGEPELLHEIGQRLVEDAPEGWTRIDVQVTAAGNRAGISMVVTMGDGTVVPVWMLVPETAAAIMKLRTDVYREDTGTWYNAVIVIDEDRRLRVEYDYDSPPFGPYDTTDPNIVDQITEVFEDLIEDHKALPRLPWNLPAWHPASRTDPARLPGTVHAVMVAAAPTGWRQLRVRYSAAADVVAATFSITMANGTVFQRESLPGLDLDLVAASRRAFYQRENRPWYNAVFTLEEGRDLQVEYDDHGAPFGGIYNPDGWGDGEADPELLRADHGMFPVQLVQLPHWHPAKERDFALDRGLLDQLRKTMLAAAPGPWRRLTLEVRAVADVVKTRLVAEVDDREYDTSAVLGDDGVELVKALREDAFRARPAKGAWYGARFVLGNPHTMAAVLDYDTPPSMDFPDPGERADLATDGARAGEEREAAAVGADIDPELLRRDHEMYPREAQYLPAWHPARDNTA